eukprot:8620560-Karenia_brevis.AAC.1
MRKDREFCCKDPAMRIMLVGDDFNNLPKDEDAVALKGPAACMPRSTGQAKADEREWWDLFALFTEISQPNAT